MKGISTPSHQREQHLPSVGNTQPDGSGHVSGASLIIIHDLFDWMIDCSWLNVRLAHSVQSILNIAIVRISCASL